MIQTQSHQRQPANFMIPFLQNNLFTSISIDPTTTTTTTTTDHQKRSRTSEVKRAQDIELVTGSLSFQSRPDEPPGFSSNDGNRRTGRATTNDDHATSRGDQHGPVGRVGRRFGEAQGQEVPAAAANASCSAKKPKDHQPLGTTVAVWPWL